MLDRFEFTTPVSGVSDWESRFKFSLFVDGEDKGLWRVAAAFALFCVCLETPVIAGGAGSSGRACGLDCHSGNW